MPVKDRPLAGKPTATVEQAIRWARSNGAAQIMLDLAPFYWEYAEKVGINPVFSYCQTAYEEAFLTYKGCLLDASFKNTAGIKKSNVSDTASDSIAECHMRFATWEDSVKAQIDHAALYAGLKGYPKKYPSETTDPRHFQWCFGIGKTVLEWAPHYSTNSYGEALLKMMDSLENTKVTVSDNLQTVSVILPRLRQGMGKNGTYKAQVITLQILLTGYGFSCGPCGIDGSFGPNTETAVKGFQKKKGLTVDGVVGSATWNALLNG